MAQKEEDLTTLWVVRCSQCGNDLLTVYAYPGHEIFVSIGGEGYFICGECGKTERYLWVEDGEPQWAGMPTP